MSNSDLYSPPNMSFEQLTQYTRRNNSISSFHSLTSTTSVSKQHNKPPRSNSTADLFDIDEGLMRKKFKRSSPASGLSKSTSLGSSYRAHHSMATQVNPYTATNQLSKPSKLSRSSTSHAVNGQTTFVPNDNYSFLLPTPPQSASAEHRRRSLPTGQPTPCQMNKQSLFNQEQDPYSAHQQYQQKIRSSPNYLQYRPKQERRKQNVSYTFPNGEVYIPRSKQGSFTNLPQLMHYQQPPSEPATDQPPTPPLTGGSTTTLTTNSEESLSLSLVTSEPKLHLDTTKRTTTPPPPTTTTDQQQQHHRGSSSSPSCTESNSSYIAQEITPPSSIDDFTVQPQNDNNNQLAGSIVKRNSSVLCEEVLSHRADSSEMDVDLVIPERSAKRPIPSPLLRSGFDTSPQRRESVATGAAASIPSTDELKTKHSLTSIAPSFLSTNSSVPSQQQGQQRRGLPEALVSERAERKPSLVKRIFKKLGFSSESNNEKQQQKRKSNIKSSPSTTSLASSLFKRSSIVNFPQSQPDVSPFSYASPLKKTAAVDTGVSDVDSGDDLSLFETTEEKINVGNVNNFTKKDFDSTDELIDDFNTETILNSMFESLNITDIKPEHSDDVGAELKSQAAIEEEEVVVDRTVPLPSPADEFDDDGVMDFKDLAYIEKIIEFGDTSFPNLKLEDFGNINERKLLKRVKSIERRKPRAMSTPTNISSILEKEKGEEENRFQNVKFVLINELKSPPSAGKVHPLKSSLSTRRAIRNSTPMINEVQTPSVPTRSKSVSFSSNVYLQTTYPSAIYNRKSQRDNTNYIINTPSLIQNVRMEVNEFKREMLVHSMSTGNTHFFKA